MRISGYLLTVLVSAVAGISLGNAVVEHLNLDSTNDRALIRTSLKALVTPASRETLALQKAIYQSRRDALVEQEAELESQLQSVYNYLEPLEADLQQYRSLRSERIQLSQEEQTRLYIDLVSRYRDYQRALNSLDTFVPLAEGETLLALPSVYRDLIIRRGGQLALEHNRFLEQERDAAFAGQHEPGLRRFLAEFDLNSVIIECRQTLCELHLSGQWEDPYYQAFEAIYSQLEQQPWYSLRRLEQAHQHRGEGIQIAVWILGAGE